MVWIGMEGCSEVVSIPHYSLTYTGYSRLEPKKLERVETGIDNRFIFISGTIYYNWALSRITVFFVDEVLLFIFYQNQSSPNGR